LRADPAAAAFADLPISSILSRSAADAMRAPSISSRLSRARTLESTRRRDDADAS
jgi:hypothetical protein